MVDSFASLVIAGFSAGRLVTLPRGRLYDCYMEEAYEGGLSVVFKYGPGRRLQGLSGVRIVCVTPQKYHRIFIIILLYIPGIN